MYKVKGTTFLKPALIIIPSSDGHACGSSSDEKKEED